MSLATWLNGSYGTSSTIALEHPMIPKPARLWEEAAHFPQMRLALDHPGYLTISQRNLIVQKFFPPMTVASFHFMDNSSRVITCGNTDLVSNVFSNGGIGIIELFSLYSTVRRASGAHFDPDQRTCHWTACPHYGPNFCNSFPRVPRVSYQECTFPKVTSDLVRIVSRHQGG